MLMNKRLIKCKDCGEEISRKAKACPKCGRTQSKAGAILLLIIGLIIYLSALQNLWNMP